MNPPYALIEVPSGFDDDETNWYVVTADREEFLGLWTVGHVEANVCHPRRTDPIDPGPSVEDLADALVALDSIRSSTPEPVTLGGYEGLYVELVGTRALRRCPDPGLWEDPGGRGTSYGQVDMVLIVDVDGQRLVVDAAYSAKSTASDIDKLTAMVNSLEFVAAAEK